MTKGIVPAAGKATRIGGLPKYLLPVPGGYLLERMLSRINVPCYIGASVVNSTLLSSYKRPEDTVYEVDSHSMPETILAAREFVGDENVLVGMPDTYWTDESVFQELSACLDGGAICALAVWLVSADMASRLGVCIPMFKYDISPLGGIEDKQPQNEERFVWGAAAWKPDFWRYIRPEDAHLGIAFNRALGQNIIPLYTATGDYYDNGTPEDYFRCIRELTEDVHATE